MRFAPGRASALDCWSLPTRTRRPRFDVPATMLPFSIKHSPPNILTSRTPPVPARATRIRSARSSSRAMDQPSGIVASSSMWFGCYHSRDCSPSCIAPISGSPPRKMSAAGPFKRLGTSRRDPMINRPYAVSVALIRIWLLGLAAQITISASAAAQSPQAAGSQEPPLMDPLKEIALALSACPPSVAGKAAVYVLDHAGYIKVRDGENGFTAIVQHAVPASQDPQCIDAEGTRTFLPRYLKVAEWRAQGKTADEIKLLVADAFAKGIFKPPAKPGIDYMLSTENLTLNARGEIVHFPPHVMFYAPYLTNADLGVGGPLGQDGNPDGPAFVAGEGTPQALIIVPVAAGPGAHH